MNGWDEFVDQAYADERGEVRQVLGVVFLIVFGWGFLLGVATLGIIWFAVTR